MTYNKSEPPRLGHYLPDAFKTLLPGIAVLCLLLAAHYKITLDQESDLILQKAQATTELTHQMMDTRLREMTSDARILADHVSSVGLESLRARDLTGYFLRFASHKPAYAQLRFIAANGRELVRINNVGGLVAVPPAQLQNKSGRYYFQQGVTLASGEVYISPFDLNVEQGKVEENNPTLRVAAAVRQGNKVLGIVVLNLNGAELFEQVWGSAAIAADAIALVSSNGFSLIRPQAETNRLTFSNSNPLAEKSPDLWQKISRVPQGQILFKNSFFSFSSLDVDQAIGNNQWKIFTILNEGALQQVNAQFAYTNLPLYGLMALMIVGISILHARHQYRHQQVQEHNAYERSFRHLLEEIELAAVSLDRAGNIRFCNDYFLALTGYQRSDVDGGNWLQMFIPKEYQLGDSKQISETFSGQRAAAPYQGNILTREQESLTLAWTCTLQQNSDGFVEQISLVGEDITARLEAEKEIRLLTQAVEQSANTVMMTNTLGGITYVNPAFCNLTGYQPEEVLGRNPSFLKSGYTSDDQYLELWQLLRKGETWQGEFHNRKKNGELFWESVVISPVRDSQGKTMAYIAVKQDVTEEKRLQTELEQETRERVRNEQLAAVGRMANMVAHDLRNPLSSIKVGLQMTSRKPDLDSGSRELCQISLDQIRHMEGILEDMLTYARPDELRQEWLSINQLLEQVVMGQLRLIQDRNVFIDQDFDNNLPRIYADPVKLRQAIQNLVVNAIQAAEASESQIARVALKTRLLFSDQGHKLEIAISNNGSTIDPCICDKVFEPFYTTKAKGTGLGLAIVQRIIQQHTGQVRLEPMAESGTRAVVLLPVESIAEVVKEEMQA